MRERVSLLIDRALKGAADGAHELSGLGFESGYSVERWLLRKIGDREWERALREAADLHRAFADLTGSVWDETDDIPIDMYPMLPPTSPPTEWPDPFPYGGSSDVY